MRNSKDKKNSQGLRDKKKLDISALAVIDNIVFSKTEQWAYYRIPNTLYDFLSVDGKIASAARIANALNNIMSDKQSPVDGHIIITNIPIDVDSWESQVRKVSEDWDRAPGFEDYINQQSMFLKNCQFIKKAVYFGVNLGKRGALNFNGMNFFELGLKGAFETLKNWWDVALSVPNEEISAEEENEARKKEEDYYRTLSSGNLRAWRCNSEELLLLIKRQFYPSMPAPYLDVDHGNRLGPGDIELESYSAIENKYRWLKINQQIGENNVSGYRACLSFSKFPKQMDYPYDTFPFLYAPSKLGLPFTCYSRFTLFPSEKMKKELEKKRKEQKDELENMAAGQDAYDSAINGIGTDASESIDDLQQISAILSQDKTPWVEGSYRIIVETPSEEILRKYCSIVKQKFNDLNININWTAGDQAELFLEQMPGDHLRIKSFKQITNLNMLAASGFNFSSDVGDPIYGSDSGVVRR